MDLDRTARVSSGIIIRASINPNANAIRRSPWTNIESLTGSLIIVPKNPNNKAQLGLYILKLSLAGSLIRAPIRLDDIPVRSPCFNIESLTGDERN